MLPSRYFSDLTQPEIAAQLKGILNGHGAERIWHTHYTGTCSLIAGGFPVSLRLGGIAVLLALVVGVAIGTLAALRQNTSTDYAAMGAAMTGIMVPNFVLAPLLTLVFGLWLSWLPVGGWDGSIKYMILPVFALSLYQVGFIARLTRGSMIEVLRTNYVRTARAKGLSTFRIVAIHALRNAMIPVVTVIGLQVGTLMGGAILTETIFSWPGVGKWLIEGINRRDYPVLQGGTLMIGAIVMIVNLLVDVAYGLINPRIRHTR